MKTAVSVVIPSYQRAAVVSRAVESALFQTHAPSEILVVDDGSTDGTAEMLAARFAAETRVRVIRLSENRGAQAARIEGIRQAKFEWVAFLDSDDVWTLDSLERRLAAAEAAPFEAAFVYGDWWWTNGERRACEAAPRLSGHVFPELCRRIHAISYVTLIVRRSVFEVCGYPDPDLPAMQDEDMALTVARHFPGLHCGGAPLAMADVRGRRISSDRVRRTAARERLLAKYMPDVRRHHGRTGVFFWKLRLAQARVNDRYVAERRTADRLLNAVLARFLRLYFSKV